MKSVLIASVALTLVGCATTYTPNDADKMSPEERQRACQRALAQANNEDCNFSCPPYADYRHCQRAVEECEMVKETGKANAEVLCLQ
jgi:hypothetical protein